MARRSRSSRRSTSGASLPNEAATGESSSVTPTECRHRCGDKAQCGHACCQRWASSQGQPVRHAVRPTVGQPVLRKVQAFLDTQEILEMALLQLGPRELLVASDVSPRWRTTIRKNIFRKALFLDADDTERTLPDTIDLFGRTFDAEDMPTSSLLNNALLQLCPPGVGIYDSNVPQVRLLGNPMTNTDTSSIRRQMFLTQPPCEWLHVGLEVLRDPYYTRNGSRRFGGVYNHAIHIDIEGGITYNDLIERIQNVARNWRPGCELDWANCQFVFDPENDPCV